ncbi:YihY family inner membrane protein [Helicobacter aurati]|uniref:YihY family inner membrane protein n=2 Tax=Helicobacter aurati TaxID=137778 RepID=A0A3D8J6S3_9HELI|nr:YihY family inner membrane protein [Helicobacter aurati]
MLQTKIYDKYYKYRRYYHDFTDKEKIFHYASSLSFYNIFSIIPLLLVFISIFTTFPVFHNQIATFKKLILDNILPNNTNEILLMIDRFLLNGKEMGFIGFLVALVSSFFFFRNFDDISARIFMAKKRNVFDSFIIYWLLITLMPIFFVTSIYFGAIVSPKYWSVFMEMSKIIPMLTTWLIFAILFRIAANKSMRFTVLALSSLIGASIWYLFRSVFVYYMSYNQFYKNIYGSISIIMFVFLWIYVSWLIILISMRFCKKLDDKLPLKTHNN